MSRFATWFFAVTALVLLGFIFIYKPLAGSTRDRRISGGVAVEFDPAAVDAIEILRGPESLLMKKSDAGWWIESPLKDRASSGEIEKLLELASNLRILDVISDAEFKKNFKNARFGFSPPPNRLRLASGKREIELLFGGEAAGENRVYLRVGKSRDTMVVSDEILNLMLRPPGEFRDPRLADFPAHLVEKVRIETGEGALALARNGQGWKFTEPLHAPADSAGVDRILEHFLGAKVFEFTEPGPVDAAEPGAGGGRVEIWPEGGAEPVVFQISNPGGDNRLLSVRSSVRPGGAKIDPGNAALLSATPDALRMKSLLQLNPDVIDRISIRAADGIVEIGRTDSGWGVFPPGRAADNAAADFFKNLSELQAERFVPLSSASGFAPSLFEKPELEVVLSSHLSENTPEETAGTFPLARFRFARAPDGTLLSRIDDQPEVLVLPADSLEKLRSPLSVPSPTVP